LPSSAKDAEKLGRLRRRLGGKGMKFGPSNPPSVEKTAGRPPLAPEENEAKLDICTPPLCVPSLSLLIGETCTIEKLPLEGTSKVPFKLPDPDVVNVPEELVMVTRVLPLSGMTSLDSPSEAGLAPINGALGWPEGLAEESGGEFIGADSMAKFVIFPVNPVIGVP